MAIFNINPGGVQYISRRLSGQDRLAVIGDHGEEVCASIIRTSVIRHTEIISELAQSGAFKSERTLRLGHKVHKGEKIFTAEPQRAQSFDKIPHSLLHFRGF